MIDSETQRIMQITGNNMDQDLIDLIDGEGNFEEWIDEEYSGYLCRIRRVKPYSCWCGYVRVPDAHNCSGKSYDYIDVDIHGGLTFGSNNFPDRKDDEKGYYWFGFDCGHAGDRIPYLWKDGTYST